MKNNVDNSQTTVVRTVTLLAVLGWFVAAFTVGLAGILDEPGRPPLVLLGFVALPMLGFVAAYMMSAPFRAFTLSLDLTWIVGSHLWRLVGLGFVWGWLRGALPGGFAIPEGFGDIVAALGALALVPMLVRGTAPRGWLLAWNVFGFADLVSAITLGILDRRRTRHPERRNGDHQVDGHVPRQSDPDVLRPALPPGARAHVQENRRHERCVFERGGHLVAREKPELVASVIPARRHQSRCPCREGL